MTWREEPTVEVETCMGKDKWDVRQRVNINGKGYTLLISVQEFLGAVRGKPYWKAVVRCPLCSYSVGQKSSKKDRDAVDFVIFSLKVHLKKHR